MNCPCCHQPMRIFAANADHPDELSAECTHDECDFAKVTMPLADHAAMTAAEVDGYVRMNRAFRARRAAFVAREAVRA